MSSKTSARRLLQEAEERAARADCAACAARVAANKAHLVPLMDPKLWASMYEHAHTAAVEAEATARVAWSAISGELEDEAIEEEFTEFAFATYETYRLHGRSQEEAMQRVIEVAERGDRDESLAAIRAAWAVSPPQLPEQRGTGIAALAAAFGAHIQQIIGGFDHIHIMFDDHNGIALVGKGMEDVEQLVDVGKMQTGGGLV